MPPDCIGVHRHLLGFEIGKAEGDAGQSRANAGWLSLAGREIVRLSEKRRRLALQHNDHGAGGSRRCLERSVGVAKADQSKTDFDQLNLCALISRGGRSCTTSLTSLPAPLIDDGL